MKQGLSKVWPELYWRNPFSGIIVCGKKVRQALESITGEQKEQQSQVNTEPQCGLLVCS